MIYNIINKKRKYDEQYDIFKYINPNNNDILSSLNKHDLKQLLRYINNYYLDLRPKLNLDRNITFGLEIEVENALCNEIQSNILRHISLADWYFDDDVSLYHGMEIISPILTDRKYFWQQLETILSIARDDASIDIHSGGHIHIGAHILGKDCTSWMRFIKLWATYENVIYRFCYGEFLTARPLINNYARPIAKMLANEFKVFDYFDYYNPDMLDDITNMLGVNNAFNFSHVNLNADFKKSVDGNTIEFRCPNGSLSPVIWQNNVNLFAHLLKYSTSSKYDNAVINKRFMSKVDKLSNLKYYNKIHLEDALELTDLIFNENLNKIYFLRQYLKSFEVSDEFIKTKPFVKSKDKKQ